MTWHSSNIINFWKIAFLNRNPYFAQQENEIFHFYFQVHAYLKHGFKELKEILSYCQHLEIKLPVSRIGIFLFKLWLFIYHFTLFYFLLIFFFFVLFQIIIKLKFLRCVNLYSGMFFEVHSFSKKRTLEILAVGGRFDKLVSYI